MARYRPRTSPPEWLRPKEPRKVLLSVRGQYLRLRIPTWDQKKSPKPPRGDVTEFTDGSRRRMQATLAQLDYSKAGFVCFVTLTYPDRSGPPSAQSTERDRQTIFKRLKRRFPEASAIWRREWEVRKSGDFVGVQFPHYHLLLFGLPFLPADELNRMWREVIGHEDYVRTEIKAVESWRQAMYYVTKYMAKPGKVPQATPRAGEPAVTAGTPPGETGRSCSLVYVSYLTAVVSADVPVVETEKLGRSWGIFNRKHLPLAELRRIELPPGEWLRDAKVLGHQYWRGISPDIPGGFTVYSEDAHDIFEMIEGMAKDGPEHWDEDGEYDPIPF